MYYIKLTKPLQFYKLCFTLLLMLFHTKNFALALTTFNLDLLRISLSAISKLKQNFTLIIFNDNPEKTLTNDFIHKSGYKGKAIIINSDENVGLLKARHTIISKLEKLKTKPEWTIFVDDDDLLINSDLPNVSDKNFAIIQNRLIIKHRLSDLFKAINTPYSIIDDGENVIIDKPHIGFAGTPIKTDILIGMGNVLNTILDEIQKINDALNYLAPIDIMMWSFVNIYAKHFNKSATPIYMDKVNYISVELDSASKKYGKLIKPSNNAEERYSRLLQKYDYIFRNALGAMTI